MYCYLLLSFTSYGMKSLRSSCSPAHTQFSSLWSETQWDASAEWRGDQHGKAAFAQIIQVGFLQPYPPILDDKIAAFFVVESFIFHMGTSSAFKALDKWTWTFSL